MVSERPAEEVLAIHNTSDQNESSIKRELTQPTFHSNMVCVCVCVCVCAIYRRLFSIGNSCF